ncbi:cytochrome c-type biogenesis CcmF C-terminal domain-containing protein [Shigella flexneri]
MLVAAMLVVLLGTLLPLVHKQLRDWAVFRLANHSQRHVYLADGASYAVRVGPLVRWGGMAHVNPQFIDYRLHLRWCCRCCQWLFESKVVAMTGARLAMACWIAVLAIAEAALRLHTARNHLQLLGDGGGSPWAGSDNCWHCLLANL